MTRSALLKAGSTFLLSFIFLLQSFGQPAKAEADIRDIMQQSAVAGLSVAVVKKGKIIYTHSFGMKEIETNTQLKEDKKVRTLWDEEMEKWYFSIIDVIAVLTNNDRPRKYWSDLKTKLKKEGSELSGKIGQLKKKTVTS